MSITLNIIIRKWLNIKYEYIKEIQKSKQENDHTIKLDDFCRNLNLKSGIQPLFIFKILDGYCYAIKFKTTAVI